METIESMLNYLGIDYSEKLQNKFKGILFYPILSFFLVTY